MKLFTLSKYFSKGVKTITVYLRFFTVSYVIETLSIKLINKDKLQTTISTLELIQNCYALLSISKLFNFTNDIVMRIHMLVGLQVTLLNIYRTICEIPNTSTFI